jgi:amino-acid N-acetyltransferase
MWACGRASVFGNRRLFTSPSTQSIHSSVRGYAYAAAVTQAHPDDDRPGRYVRTHGDAVVQRELFMDILSANATRRDAKQYLSRFKTPAKPQLLDPNVEHNARHRKYQDRLDRLGVNLGGLYAPARAIADNPQFVREEKHEKAAVAAQQTLHTAVVCLRAPEMLDDVTMEGLAVTLSQLVKLDMHIVTVLDQGSSTPDEGLRSLRTEQQQQAERLAQAVSRHSPEGSRFISGALTAEGPAGRKVHAVRELLLSQLKRGKMPIIPPLAYTDSGQLVKADVGEVMAGVTKALCHAAKCFDDVIDGRTEPTISVDRIIVLDSAGGVPSKDRSDNAHVFINLEQEYDDILTELSRYAAWDDTVSRPNMYDQHQANLKMLQKCLGMLPPASSGLIISPHEAAMSSQRASPVIGAVTRRQKNSLIHNLLTNKPMVSSSLPTARLSPNTGDAAPLPAATATLVKRGMPLDIVPAVYRGQGWQVPTNGKTEFDLRHDKRVDFPRLVHLIEDSFRRKLNVDHYMHRIAGRTAGLIVAGDYEGAAILTWEQAAATGSKSSTRLVPYLDKFAVLQSSQGSSGVADILFQSMVRSCFPRGVCWRSRKDNPVNKWYFERATGSWQIPNTNWTMFWTGEGVVEDAEKFGDYVAVCEGVEPSWADGKRPD